MPPAEKHEGLLTLRMAVSTASDSLARCDALLLEYSSESQCCSLLWAADPACMEPVRPQLMLATEVIRPVCTVSE